MPAHLEQSGQRGYVSENLGIPVGWRILELGVRDDYFDIWKRIREHAPVYDAGEGVFLVTEWELVNSALRNPILRAGSGVSAAFGQDSPACVAIDSTSVYWTNTATVMKAPK